MSLSELWRVRATFCASQCSVSGQLAFIIRDVVVRADWQIKKLCRLEIGLISRLVG